MARKVEVNNRSGEFVGNQLRFAGKKEAKGYAVELAWRSRRPRRVRRTRVVECDDALNCTWAKQKK